MAAVKRLIGLVSPEVNDEHIIGVSDVGRTEAVMEVVVELKPML